MSRDNATWRVGSRELLWCAGGTLLYGSTSWLTSFSPLAGAFGGQIRPGVAIPIVLGFTSGPVVGFFTGFLGNLLTDVITGAVHYPPHPGMGSALHDVITGFNLNWQSANGLMGLIPGLYALYYRRYVSLSDQAKALLVMVLGVIIGIGFAAVTDPWVYHDMTLSTAVTTELIPISAINIVNAAILTPILLFNYERLDLSSSGWVRSGVMQRLLLAILISAALPVALLGLFLTQGSAASQPVSSGELTTKLVFTILLTLVFTITNAVLIAQTISRPLLRLMDAAHKMQEGRLSVEQAGELSATSGSDEVTRLSRIFGQMAQQVIQREQQLIQQVRELQIIIDQGKRDAQVAEIVDTNFFHDLQEQTREMRKNSSPIPTSAGMHNGPD